MRKKVVRKQTASHGCFICGRDNPASTKADFYEMEDSTLVTLVTCRKEHMGFPSILHGGVTASILDEAMGRSYQILNPGYLGMTIEMNIKYFKPVPYDVELKVVTRAMEASERTYRAEGKLYLPNGKLAASGEGVYLKADQAKKEELSFGKEDVLDVTSPDDPEYIDIP